MNIFVLGWVLQLEKRESTLHPLHPSPKAVKKCQLKQLEWQQNRDSTINLFIVICLCDSMCKWQRLCQLHRWESLLQSFPESYTWSDGLILPISHYSGLRLIPPNLSHPKWSAMVTPFLLLLIGLEMASNSFLSCPLAKTHLRRKFSFLPLDNALYTSIPEITAMRSTHGKGQSK